MQKWLLFVRTVKAKASSQRHLVEEPSHHPVVGAGSLSFTHPGAIDLDGILSPACQAQGRSREGAGHKPAPWSAQASGEDRPRLIKIRWAEQVSVEQECEEVRGHGTGLSYTWSYWCCFTLSLRDVQLSSDGLTYVVRGYPWLPGGGWIEAGEGTGREPC